MRCWGRATCGEDKHYCQAAGSQVASSTFDDFSAQEPSTREEMAKEGLAGYVVPSTDAHQVAVETYLSLLGSSRPYGRKIVVSYGLD